MSIYRKTEMNTLNKLMDTIYQCQRGVHNFEQWGDFEEFEKIELAMDKIVSQLKQKDEIIEKLKNGISAELKRCGGTVPILRQTLKEVKEMEQHTGEE